LLATRCKSHFNQYRIFLECYPRKSRFALGLLTRRKTLPPEKKKSIIKLHLVFYLFLMLSTKVESFCNVPNSIHGANHALHEVYFSNKQLVMLKVSSRIFLVHTISGERILCSSFYSSQSLVFNITFSDDTLISCNNKLLQDILCNLSFFWGGLKKF